MIATDIAANASVAIRSRGWVGRALLVLALSILAHAVVLVTGRRALVVPLIESEKGGLIEAMLLRSPSEPPPALPPPRPPVKAPLVRREAPPAPAAQPAPEPIPEPAAEPAPAPSIDPAPPVEEPTAPPPEPALPLPPVNSELPPPETGLPIVSEFDASGAALVAEVDSAQAQRALLPISARYVYQTTDTRFPAVTGTTTVDWHFEEDRTYTAHLLTTVFGLTVFDLNSSGRVLRFGLAPDRYTERTIGRAQWATGFDWETRRVTFSTRDQARELREGMQDRLSFQFQLMVLGQRLPSRFQTGRSIVLPVGARVDVTTYRFTVIGNERLPTGAGELDTVKLERAKSADGGDSRIEVWLAPEHAWLPVKLRFTDRRDNVTENLLSDITIPVQ